MVEYQISNLSVVGSSPASLVKSLVRLVNVKLVMLHISVEGSDPYEAPKEASK